MVWVALTALTPAAHAERRGSISFGAFAGYGGIFASTRENEDTSVLDTSKFDFGFDYGIRLHYKLRGPAALGTSVEAQNFSVTGARADSLSPKSLRMTIWTLEYTRYFKRASSRSTYVVAGVALLPTVYGNIGASLTQPAHGDGYGLVLGAGREILKGTRADGIDMAVRIYPHIVASQTGITAQVTIGWNHYMEP